MKIIGPNGNSKQNLMDLFANRLYNSQPAIEYFKDAEYSPELLDAVKAGVNDPLNFKKNTVDLGDGNSAVFRNAGTTGRLLVENMKAHPFKTAGGALLGGANLAGLFDNDKIIGQAAGLGAGGLAAKYLLPKFGVGGIANGALAVMGGGALGSLFDKLMAKKAEEEAAMQAAYAGQY